jgi:hypothetical protein
MKKLLLILMIATSLFSCRKTYDNTNDTNKIILPQYSEAGSSTFGFMLNNSVWTVFGKHKANNGFGPYWMNNTFDVSSFGPADSVRIVAGGQMTIVQSDSATTDVSAGFSFIPTIPYKKSYFLTNVYPGNFSIVDKIHNRYYQVNPLRPLVLEVTKFDKIDDLQRILSGRFNGVLYNEVNPNDSIIVSDGRFDTKVIFR